MARCVLGCIADDFTGATDLANNLVRSGMRTTQVIGIPDRDAAPVDADAIVVALKSRTSPAAEAVAQSLNALRWLQSQGAEQIYFKYCSTFDSTSEGNIGPVTEALLDALEGAGRGFTIACPAFPENQRSVFKGHLFVGDVLLSDSGMRSHPLTPMTDSNLVRVMQSQTRRRVGLIAREVVAQGPEAIGRRIDVLKTQGIGIAVIDAVSNDDLMLIGPALAGMPLVTAGSGIAIGLIQNWRARGQLTRSDGVDRLPDSPGARAIVSGSCSVATNAQVLHFKQSGGSAFAIDPLALAADDTLMEAALDWARVRLPEGPVLVYATANTNAVRAVQERLGASRAGEIVERALSMIALGLVRAGVRQLVVAGGETSGAVVQRLGVQRMVIGPQIDPGVPWTSVEAAAAQGKTLSLALKSGNFGSDDFFTKAFTVLNSNR
jgi:3-dehydrotetronate 4-kinase